MTAVLSRPERNEHIAPCGLFCTHCYKFKKGKCEGCQIQPGFTKCAIRTCCEGKGITICSDCSEFQSDRDFRECAKVNNFIAKIFAVIFRSNRPGALALIRDKGRAIYLEEKRLTGKM